MMHISGSTRVGCVNRAYFEELVGYAVGYDDKAFDQALASGVALGVCVQFENYQSVFIVETALFSGLVRVRPEGQIAEYWTNLESVK